MQALTWTDVILARQTMYVQHSFILDVHGKGKDHGGLN